MFRTPTTPQPPSRTAMVIGRNSPVPPTQPDADTWNGELVSPPASQRSPSPVAPPLPPCKPKPQRALFAVDPS